MRGAAMQLIRNVLQECGRLLAIAPDQSSLSNDLDVVEAAISSEHAEKWVAKKCRIPSVVAEILVQKATLQQEPADDVLDIVKHVTAPAEDDTEVAIHAEEMPAVESPVKVEANAA